jgi:HEAT repeat protein
MRALLSLSLLLLVPVAVQAEILELNDGTQLVGAYIGEAEGTLTFLPVTGKAKTVDRAEVARIDWTHKAPAKLQKRAQRARLKFVKKRRREVSKLLKAYGRAKDDAARDEIGVQLKGFSENALLKPLSDALSDTKQATREFAVKALVSLETSKAVGPLVKAALTTKHKALGQSAHGAALTLDKTLTRRFYESVAASQTKPRRRVLALGHLGAMGERASVPGLVRVLEHVNAEIRATLATAGGLKRVPVNLGTIGGAGVNVPIELPEVNLIEIQTSVSVPVLRAVEGAAVEALKRITKQDLGNKSQDWKGWWKKQPDAEPETRRDDR